MTTALTLDKVLGRLPDARPSGREWKARCPAHKDRTPSLSIGVNADGRVLLYCHGGCTQRAVFMALGLELPALTTDRARTAIPLARPAAAAVAASAPNGSSPKGRVTRYSICDEKAVERAVHVRTDQDRGGKRFRWEREGRNGLGGLAVTSLPLYGTERLAEVPDDSIVFVTEGEKACDALRELGYTAVGTVTGASAIPGVHALRPLQPFRVRLWADNDDMGREHMQSLGQILRLGVGIRDVRVIDLADAPRKGDAADFVREQGNTACEGIDALLISATDLELDESHLADQARGLPYRRTAHGIVWRKGDSDQLLANFDARVVGEVSEDDGVSERMVLELEARQGARSAARRMTVETFRSLDWAIEMLGAAAIVSPGPSMAGRFRAAVQALSGSPPRRRVFRHTGWREIDGEQVYLHAAGGIGRGGQRHDLEVALGGALSRFELPSPTDDAGRLAERVRASLSLAELTEDAVVIPVLASVWRSVLGPADFGVFIIGRTGAGKSELASLAMAHFGDFDARHLPGSWSSTANALEQMAFTAKDAVLVVDDFAPSGARQDRQRMHQAADRLLRAQGNRAGRQRLRADATLLDARPPRGTIISTGEDLPLGHSLRARCVVVELDALDWSRLTDAQEAARDGAFAEAMAGFLRWLAPRMNEMPARLGRLLNDARRHLRDETLHRRIADSSTHLLAAVDTFLEFATESAAVTGQEAAAWHARAVTALRANAAAQEQHHRAADPVHRFHELVTAALVSGDAHIAGQHASNASTVPEHPDRWGWVPSAGGSSWIARGSRIGWIDGEGLFLEPTAAYAAAGRMAEATGEGLPVTPYVLQKRLADAGVIRTESDGSSRRYTVRHSIGGRRLRVLHFVRGPLSPRSGPSGPIGPSEPSANSADTEIDRFSGPLSDDWPNNRSAEAVHSAPEAVPEPLYARSGPALSGSPVAPGPPAARWPAGAVDRFPGPISDDGQANRSTNPTEEVPLASSERAREGSDGPIGPEGPLLGDRGGWSFSDASPDTRHAEHR